VIVSRAAVIRSGFSTVVCAPVCTHGQGLSTQVEVGVDEGLKHESWILCDGLVSVENPRLTDYVGTLSGVRIRALNRALRSALEVGP
jgi:mRNA interferase MazF